MTKNLIKQHGEKLKVDFNHNKKVISELTNIESKKIRNTVAGYIAKSIKAQKQE